MTLPRRGGRLALVGLVGMTVGFGGLAAPAVSGASTPIQVTTTADGGTGSLRQALADAVDGDTITFAPSVTGSIHLLSALMVDSGVTIVGPGAGALSIDGGNQVQDLVLGGNSSSPVTVSGLTLTHGSGSTGGAVQDISGGGLALVRDVVTESTASVAGGGLYLSSPQRVTVTDTTISGNTAPKGGGIYAEVALGAGLSVQDSTISGNTASTGQGAGIYASSRGFAPALAISSRGAEAPKATRPPPPPPPPAPNPTSVGPVVVQTSTIAGNVASGAGAAIYLGGLDSTTMLSADTVAQNKATGLMLDSPVNAYPSLTAAIVADNRGDCLGSTMLDGGYNVDSDGSCNLGATGSDPHSATIDAALGSLRLNGGPTPTIAITAAADPAHDVVPASFVVPGATKPLCKSADQRGVLPAAAPCDIGAFQRERAPTISASLHSKAPKTHFGWYGSPVHVTFTCHSASKLISVTCAHSVDLDHSGRHVSATGKVTAQDGRTATVEVRGLSIDTVAPTVDGTTCHDALSGIASCKIHRHAGRTGAVTVTVTAVDKAGNRTVRKGHET